VANASAVAAGEGEGIESSQTQRERESQRTLLPLLLVLVVMWLPWQRSGATSYRHGVIAGFLESPATAGKSNVFAACGCKLFSIAAISGLGFSSY